MLEGKKVILRPIEISDLVYIQRWKNDPEIARYIWPGVPNPLPLEKVKDWYSELLDDSSSKYYLICDKDNNPIGLVGIEDINFRSRKGSLFIIIGAKDYQGKGYGSEALILFLGVCFRILNLHRVFLEVYENNERAIKAYEKVGFKKEGYVRRSVFKEGRYLGEYIMAILQDEYFSLYPIGG